MSLQYIVPINLTVIGDGMSFDLLIDLEKDYVYVAETGYTNFKDKKPVSVSPIASNALLYEPKITPDGKLLVHFPSPPAPNTASSINLNLYFEGEIEADESEESGMHPELEGGQING